jgi:hypothetical protein
VLVASNLFRDFGVVHLFVGVVEVADSRFPTTIAQELADDLQFVSLWLRHDDTWRY